MYKSERLVGYVDDLIGRGPYYARITEGFAGHKVVVVHGIGGVGKTQVLLGYVRQTELFAPDRRYALTVPTMGDLDNELAALARSLGWVSESVTEQAVVVAAAWGKLSKQGRVLVALDNVDEPKVVAEFRKKLPDAYFLVTQRKPSAFPGAQRVELAVLDREDGARFLLKRAERSADSLTEWEAAVSLSEELGGLTLALNLAGAYVLENEITIAGYRERYDKEASALLDVTFDADDSYRHSVAATVLLSLSQTKERSEAAAQLVQTVAFFADAPVPLFLWEAAKKLLPAPLSESAGWGTAWDSVVAEAARFGLVQVDVSDEALTMHRLTRRVLQKWEKIGILWTEEGLIERLLLITNLINASFNCIERYNWSKFLDVLPQADRIKEKIEIYCIKSREYVLLCSNMARYAFERGDYNESCVMYNYALDIGIKYLGEFDSDIGGILNNLAVVYRSKKDYATARQLYERSLVICNSNLGRYSLEFAMGLNNLAIVCTLQRDFDFAIALFENAVSIFETKFDGKHIEYARCLDNYAVLYKESSNKEEAVTFYERALAMRKELLGEKDPDVAMSLNNMSAFYASNGDLDNAIAYMLEAVSIYEEWMEPTHPYIINCYQSLSNMLIQQKNIAESLKWSNKAAVLRAERQAKKMN